MRCEAKVPYGSELLAQNAAWLHEAAYPECGGIDHYPCGDHFHTGHRSTAIGQACKANCPKPKLWRPARWSSSHRHPSSRPVKR